MEQLIAEDLLLLLLDDEKGTTPGGVPVATVLGGALLVDLTRAGLVDLEPTSGWWRSAKVDVEPDGDPGDPSDPALVAALAVVQEKRRPAAALVDRLGKDVKDDLADRLVERGVLQRHDKAVLGVFPSKRWVLADPAREADLRRDLTAALVHGADPDERTAALIALLSAIDRAHRVIDHEGMSSREVKRRAKTIAEGDWAAKAVRDAIRAAAAASAASITAVSAATTVNT